MTDDEEIAMRLQREFEEEAKEIELQEKNDLKVAKSIAASFQSISDTDSDSEDVSSHLRGNEKFKIKDDSCTVNVPICDTKSNNNPTEGDSSYETAVSYTEESGEPVSSEGEEADKTGLKRPLCKYGSACYRKNPVHLRDFYHPTEEISGTDGGKDAVPILETKRKKVEEPAVPVQVTGSRCNVNKPFVERLSQSEPCCFFLNKSYSVKETQQDWLTLVFPDLLSPDLGTLIESAQINFMIDLNFIMKFYKSAGLEKLPILFLYGQLEGNPREYSNVICKHVNMPFQYGVHHSKMMLLRYKEGCRVVIHTANLIEDDWTEKTQGYWLSPLFPPLGNGKPSLLEGESSTRFKHDLVEYLLSYKCGELTHWSQILKSHDMSSCRAFFVGSVPGYHIGENRMKYGHMKCRNIIRKYSHWPAGLTKPVIIQCSSIGSLGKDCKSWLTSELGVSFIGGNENSSKPTVRVIYPSEDDVRNSSQGYGGGSCLPYNSKTHSKQLWLKQHLNSWRSSSRWRTRAMPHIKTYCRLSSDLKSIQYLILTSSNLSKAAWGQLQKQGSQLFIRSYEAGVILLPKFVMDGDSFSITAANDAPVDINLPFDLPLTLYKEKDVPCSWRSSSRWRTRAMPHINTYCRLSSDLKSIQYLILTSSNLSKAAWGQLQKQGSQLFIRSYEAGVILLPKFVMDGDSFSITAANDAPVDINLPFDLPLTLYKEKDVPWFMDTPKPQPDILGATYP